MADFTHVEFNELTEVALKNAVTVQGVALPAGTRGVIMAAYADGLAFEVEFDTPHVVVTIEARDLTH